MIPSVCLSVRRAQVSSGLTDGGNFVRISAPRCRSGRKGIITMKKKIIAVILTAALAVSVCACSSKAAETTAAEAETIQAISSETVPETEESSSEAAATEESESESNSVSDTSAAETTAAAASSVDEAALKLYQDAMAKTAAAGAMDTTTKMELTTNDQSVSIDMQMITVPSGDDGKLAAKGTLASNGVSMDVEYYYTDGFYYTNAMGQKAKAASTYAEAVADSNMADAFNLGDVTSDSFNSMTAQAQADGTTLITAVFSMEDDTETAEGKVEVLVDKDGYAIRQSIQLQASTVENNTEVHTSADMTLTVNAYGDNVKIELPDLSDYAAESTETETETSAAQ